MKILYVMIAVMGLMAVGCDQRDDTGTGSGYNSGSSSGSGTTTNDPNRGTPSTPAPPR